MIKRERRTIASLILLCKPAETDSGVMINSSTKVQHTELQSVGILYKYMTVWSPST